MSKPYRIPPTLFSGYHSAKNRKMPAWTPPLMLGSFLFVALGLTTGWARSIWDIDMLDRPKVSTDLAVAPAPPPPPPPLKGGEKPKETQIIPKKPTVHDLVQPVQIVKQQQVPQETAPGDPDGDPNGDPNGQKGGQIGGDPNGQLGTPTPLPPPVVPPPPAAPQNVAPTMLEGSRVAGDKQIVPDDVTKTEIQRSGKAQLIGSFKLCLSTAGEISTVTMLRSTGFPAYDNKIQQKMRGEWRYRPYSVNGTVVPVCTAVTFVYRQS